MVQPRGLRAFPGVVRAERIKCSLGASRWAQLLLGLVVLSGMVALMLGRAAAMMAGRGETVAEQVFSSHDVLTMGWTKAGLVALLIWSGTLVTSELRTTLPATWIAVPSRASVMGAKILIAATVTALGMALPLPLLLVVGRFGGATVALADPAVWLFVLRVALGSALLAVLSVGLAALARSTTVVIIVWGLALIGEESIALAGQLHTVAAFLPMTNLWHFAGVRVFETVDPPWSPVVSLAGLAVAAALAVVLGALRLRRH